MVIVKENYLQVAIRRRGRHVVVLRHLFFHLVETLAATHAQYRKNAEVLS